MRRSTRVSIAWLLLAAFLFSEVAVAAEAGEAPLRRRNAIMVDLQGRGIYTYDLDVDPNRSACDPMCLILWPPIIADANAKPSGRFSLAELPDGRKQWAWDGKPLYRWISDRRKGEANGDGVAGVWRLVRLPCGDGDQEVTPMTRAERPCRARASERSATPARAVRSG